MPRPRPAARRRAGVRVCQKAPRATSLNVQLPCLQKDLRTGSISQEFPFRALQAGMFTEVARLVPPDSWASKLQRKRKHLRDILRGNESEKKHMLLHPIARDSSLIEKVVCRCSESATESTMISEVSISAVQSSAHIEICRCN